ncbi:MAG: class I SAM-dependent methyltransferase [Smithellaceae bacterium]|nr:class I SAM-dependent methyltransferase [Smithellaceae bacterium]
MGLKEKISGKSLKKYLGDIQKRATVKKTDISDHLAMLFTESLNIESKLIVELGVGDGESTFVLERVANLWGAKLVSVDIDDRAEVSSFKDRIFVQSDDISFAAEFPDWCRRRGFEPVIDILFIDTSHLYDHTVAEIRSWFPYLASRCKVFFHDTNMSEVFARKDGSTGKGWDNQRGVIRAIEEHLDTNFNEKVDFALAHRGWFIRHYTICNGFMIMERG